MNKSVAYQLLLSELAGYRALSYEDLSRLVGQEFSSRKQADDSEEYDLDIGVYWLNRTAFRRKMRGLSEGNSDDY